MHTAARIWPDDSEQPQFVGARDSAVVARKHVSRIGFSVAADMNSNVFDIYFLVWSLSRLLYCVDFGSSIAASLCEVICIVSVGVSGILNCTCLVRNSIG